MITVPKNWSNNPTTELELLKDKLMFKQQGHRLYKDGTELPTAAELLNLIKKLS